jgi:hypothetical protein
MVKPMNKIILIGGAVVLVVIVGGIFLLPKLSLEPNESTTTPTQWSQEGDYRIEETAQGTIVTNEKAGFSFKVPAGWRVEGGSFGEIYSLDLISPNAIIQNGVSLESGCIGSVETQSNKDFVANVSKLIEMKSNNPILYPDKTVIMLDDQIALKTIISDEGEVYSEFASIEVPLTEEGLLAISFTERSVSKGLCTQSFDSILTSLIFE